MAPFLTESHGRAKPRFRVSGGGEFSSLPIEQRLGDVNVVGEAWLSWWRPSFLAGAEAVLEMEAPSYLGVACAGGASLKGEAPGSGLLLTAGGVRHANQVVVMGRRADDVLRSVWSLSTPDPRQGAGSKLWNPAAVSDRWFSRIGGAARNWVWAWVEVPPTLWSWARIEVGAEAFGFGLQSLSA